MPTFNAAVATVAKIRFFAGTVANGSKIHINIGHETVMAEIFVFGLPDGEIFHWQPKSASLYKMIMKTTVKQNVILRGDPTFFTSSS